VQRAVLLDVVVGQGAAVLQLLARKDEALLVRGDALLVLDLGLDGLHGVARVHVQREGLAREGAHEDLGRRFSPGQRQPLREGTQGRQGDRQGKRRLHVHVQAGATRNKNAPTAGGVGVYTRAA